MSRAYNYDQDKVRSSQQPGNEIHGGDLSISTHKPHIRVPMQNNQKPADCKVLYSIAA